MSLIFDSFPTRQHAEAFVKKLESKRFMAKVYDSQEESERGFPHDPLADVFVSTLTPPIVLVARDRDGKFLSYTVERKIENLVSKFRGNFAGT